MSPRVYAEAPVERGGARRGLGVFDDEADDAPPAPPTAAPRAIPAAPFLLLAIPAALALWLYQDAFAR